MTKLSPYLKFNDGKCREAMNFYKSIFGGKLDFMTVSESPMSRDMPINKHDLIMHSSLKKGSIMFFGSDMMRDIAIVGDNVGITLECENEKELKNIFAKLSKGGEIFMKPEEQFWGGVFAMTTDKYGVEWMLNFQKKSIKKSK